MKNVPGSGRLEVRQWALFAAMILLFAMGEVAIAFPADDAFIVGTGAGKVQGKSRPSGGAEFLGIPYAQPPVGELRWRDPAPVKPSGDVRDATSFGAPCAQPVLGDWNRRDAEMSKEDCLFLNVMTPVWPPQKALPVMFWLHGGGNEGGTAASALYKDGTLVQHGIVLVTVNYRLGIFGFLSHPGLTRESPHHTSGNYALMDQIAALHWVHDNIARFGGDPANVTIFGQSAGSQDATFLMTSPAAKGLFQRIIAESGSGLDPNIPSLAVAEQRGQKVVESVKPPEGVELISYLRRLSPAELMQLVQKRDPKGPPEIGPIVDGRILPKLPAQVFAAGEEAPVSMILGTTTREFGMKSSPEDIRKWMEGVSGDLAPRMLAAYGLSNAGPGKDDSMYGTVADQWFADLIFRCPVVAQASWHTAQHTVYEYEFEHAIPGQEADGAVHSSDLPYVFGYYPRSGNIAGKFGEVDFKIADLIETYWTNFAKRGNPNSDGIPNWPVFDAQQTRIEITQSGRVVAKAGGLRRAQCDVHHAVLNRMLKHTDPAVQQSGPQ